MVEKNEVITIHFQKFGRSFGNRVLAKKVRSEVYSYLSNNKKVIFDFDNVRIVSNSFADECFGELVSCFSLGYLKKNTSFINYNSNISSIIISTMNHRLKKTTANNG